MNAPAHHLPEELLLEYATGTSSPAAALVAACHLTLCDLCTERLRTLEALGGALLETAVEPVEVTGLEATLARLEDPSAHAPEPPPRQPEDCPALPRPLLRLVERAGGLRWRFLAPGVRALALETGDAPALVRLVRLKPGLEIPLHDHADTEYTIIFSGALDDAGARFARGDVCVREPGERHIQRVTPDAPCIALVVNEGPFVPLTWKGRLLKLISGS